MKNNALAAILIALVALVCWVVSLRVRSRQYGRLKELVSRGDREGCLPEGLKRLSSDCFPLRARASHAAAAREVRYRQGGP